MAHCDTQRGFHIVAAVKGKRSIEYGINFLKSYDVLVHRRGHHLIDELVHYSWAVDRETGEMLPRLADSHNHVIDAVRYALEGARRAGSGDFTFASIGRRVMADLPGWDLHSHHEGYGSTPWAHLDKRPTFL